MTDNLVICPDGRVRRKIWHLSVIVGEDFLSACGMRVFGDNTVKPRIPGANLPHCFTPEWMAVSCADCLRAMQKGIPA